MKRNINQKTPHLLEQVWLKNTVVFSSAAASVAAPAIKDYLMDYLAVGEFYYYILDVTTGNIFNPDGNILQMHGLSSLPHHLQEIIDLVHPDDLDFVIEAEKMCYDKIRELGAESIMHFKTSYCFRMRTAGNKYELFHHQAIHTAVGQDGKIVQAVNIHTNISNITERNTYIALVTGIAGRKDFYRLQYRKPLHSTVLNTCLSVREIEVLQLICKGYSSKFIADELNISEHTVRTHRKNILAKAECKNSPELIAKAYEEGFV